MLWRRRGAPSGWDGVAGDADVLPGEGEEEDVCEEEEKEEDGDATRE